MPEAGGPSLLERARFRAIVEADLWRFRRRYGRVLRDGGPATGPVALVVSLSGHGFQLKLEGLLAKALELKGLTPVVLLSGDSAIPRRYFNAFGFDRFVQLEEFAGEDAVPPALDASETFETLKRRTFRGVPTGKYVLATMSRVLHRAHVDFSDPEVRELWVRLEQTVVRSALAAEKLVETLRPALMLFSERNYAAEAPLSDVALDRGVNVVQWVSAFQDDALVFKRYTAETRRVHPRSLADESWQLVRELEWTPERDAELEEELRLRYGHAWAIARRNHGWTRQYGREELVAALGLDPRKQTAVVFSHVLWDANMFYGDDLFPDQEEWFAETVRAACAHRAVNWVVKLHPANVWKLRRDGIRGDLGDLEILRRRVGDLPPHVKLLLPESDISTRSIFELADYGITIRGSIGIELPCFGVPVLTAGTGFYSGRGFTVDSATADEYLRRLRSIEEIPPLDPAQVELARKHAWAIFRLRPSRFASFRTVFQELDRVGHPFDQNLELTVRSAEELREAADLRSFADWAVDARTLDYLAERNA